MIEEDEALEDQLLQQIISYYREAIGDQLSGGMVDRDALVFLPLFVLRTGDIIQFTNEVGRLFSIKFRYGLIDSSIADLQIVLTIAEKHELDELKTFAYGNMGIVYQIRGDLDQALEMYGKSLALNEELGRKEGMANQYGNMGNVYETRGDLDKACSCWRESLRLFREVGMTDKIDLLENCINEECGA